jgi:hypothetical protein
MTIISAAIASEEVIRPNPSPPSGCDFVSVPPSVAPRGRVNTQAAQKNKASAGSARMEIDTNGKRAGYLSLELHAKLRERFQDFDSPMNQA